MSCCGKVKEFTTSIKDWVGSGMQMASPSDTMNRMSICKTCEYFKSPLCSKCGCVMIVKTRLATSICPEGKW
jgi:hypothetical protein